MKIYIWTLLITLTSYSVQAQNKGGNPNSVHIPEKGAESEIESKFTKATGYFLAEKFDKALKYLEPLVKKEKGNASILFMISRCYLSKNDIKLALKYSEKSISFSDSERDFYLYHISILQNQKQLQNAIKSYEKLFMEKKENQSDYIALGNLYRKSAISSENQLNILLEQGDSNKKIKLKRTDFKNYLNKEYNLYQLYSSKYPTTSEIHSKKINTLLILNKYEEAWDTGITYININPDDPSLVYDHCTIFFKKYPQKSTQLLEEKTIKKPLNVENKLLLHDFYNQLNQPQKASETILSLFKIKKFSLEKKLKITQSYLQTQTALHQETALNMMKIIKSQYPDSGIIYILEGEYYMSQLVLDTARISFLKALEYLPKKLELWEKVIRISLQKKAYEDVIKDVNKALNQKNNSPILFYFKGFSYYNLGRYDSTIKTLEITKSIKTSKDVELQINHLLADSYYKNNDFKNAWDTYDDILMVTPNDPYTLNNYSYFLALKNERLSQALSMTITLMRIAPNETNYIDTYAWVLYKNKKYSDALVVIERIALKSQSAEVIEHYGDILMKNNKSNEAIIQWKRALVIDSKSINLINKIKYSENK